MCAMNPGANVVCGDGVYKPPSFLVLGLYTSFLPDIQNIGSSMP
jgi:hypothetical protein